MLIVLALAGCGPEAPADTDVADIPSEYITDEQDPPEPTYDLVAIAAAVQGALDQVLRMDADPVFGAYDAVMAGQSGSCPNYYSDGDATYWYDQCESDAGFAFSGYGYTLLYEDYPDPESGYVYNGRGLFAAATIEAADGHLFSGAGTVYALVGDKGEEHYDQLVLQGTFRWDGAEVDGTWVGDGVSPDLVRASYRHDSYGRYVSLDGGMSPLEGEMIAVAFEDVLIYEESIGSTCEIEPAGSISVRGLDGSWYDVLFDGPTDEAPNTDPDDCDGCGTAYYRGEPMGQVCADFSQLLAEG